MQLVLLVRLPRRVRRGTISCVHHVPCRMEPDANAPRKEARSLIEYQSAGESFRSVRSVSSANWRAAIPYRTIRVGVVAWSWPAPSTALSTASMPGTFSCPVVDGAKPSRSDFMAFGRTCLRNLLAEAPTSPGQVRCCALAGRGLSSKVCPMHYECGGSRVATV